MQYEYDEINLIDYLKIIIKNKRIVLIFILIGVILGVTITLFLPKTYKAETILEIGRYGIRLDAEIGYQSLVNTVKLVEKIKYGFYGKYPDLEIQSPGLIPISLGEIGLIKIVATNQTTKAAEDYLKKLNNLILEEHNKKLEERKESLEKAIEELENKIKSLTWKNQETGIFELEIYHLRNQIEDAQSTQVIKKPTIVLGREPNLALNLIFGAVLGVFVGIFFILSREWWGKNKEKIKS